MKDRLELEQQIEKAFASVECPEPEDYTTSKGGEAYEESSEFFGKDWRGLDHTFLVTYRDVLFWFTPEAFHYYLPAFLVASLRSGDDNALYVHSILQLLREVIGADFIRTRLRLMSDAQLAAIDGWLEWLSERNSADDLFADEVRQARQVLGERRWH